MLKSLLFLLILSSNLFATETLRPQKALNKADLQVQLNQKLTNLTNSENFPALFKNTEFSLTTFSVNLEADSTWKTTFWLEKDFYLIDLNSQILGEGLYPKINYYSKGRNLPQVDLLETIPGNFLRKIDGGYFFETKIVQEEIDTTGVNKSFSVAVSDTNSSGTGKFELSIYGINANKQDSLDFELNDDFTTAKSLNQTANGTFFTLGNLKFVPIPNTEFYEPEKDFYAFNSVAGKVYEVSLNSNTIEAFNSKLDGLLKLYDSNQQLISKNDDYFYFFDSRIVFKATTQGIVYVEVSANPATNLSLGNIPYEVKIRTLENLETTPNFKIDSTNSTSTEKLDFSQSSELSFDFTTQGQGWTFAFTTFSQSLGYSLDTKLQLFFVNGTDTILLFENDDKKFPFAVDSELTATLSDSGNYRLVVKNSLVFGGTTVDYTSEELQGILAYKFLGSDANEENDFFWSATKVPLAENLVAPAFRYEQKIKGNFLDKTDKDYFVFSLQDSLDCKFYGSPERRIFYTFFNNTINGDSTGIAPFFKFYDNEFKAYSSGNTLPQNTVFPKIFTFDKPKNAYLELTYPEGKPGDYEVLFRMDAGININFPDSLALPRNETEPSWKSPRILSNFTSFSDFDYYVFKVDTNLVYTKPDTFWVKTSDKDSTLSVTKRSILLDIQHEQINEDLLKIKFIVEFIDSVGNPILLSDGTGTFTASDTLAENEELSFYFPISEPELNYLKIRPLEKKFTDYAFAVKLYAEETTEPVAKVSETDTTKNEIPELLTSYKLHQNYPNPFNPITKINYELKINDLAVAKLEIFNILGQKVNSFNLSGNETGKGFVLWNGTDFSGKQVSSGIYFYRLQAGKFLETKKMVLLR
ncbi:T9SS type A sorting domain-containing protein [bacterium]|nr:T9SS type A sorting domain-containing protein [bacterium]